MSNDVSCSILAVGWVSNRIALSHLGIIRIMLSLMLMTPTGWKFCARDVDFKTMNCRLNLFKPVIFVDINS